MIGGSASTAASWVDQTLGLGEILVTVGVWAFLMVITRLLRRLVREIDLRLPTRPVGWDCRSKSDNHDEPPDNRITIRALQQRLADEEHDRPIVATASLRPEPDIDQGLKEPLGRAPHRRVTTLPNFLWSNPTTGHADRFQIKLMTTGDTFMNLSKSTEEVES